ncbi:MAG: hypothetical protein EOM25_01580 [Deltaproteobacteria bacterium]|nr:hypothetical protein [Deltaproteobacteria bacterium]
MRLTMFAVMALFTLCTVLPVQAADLPRVMIVGEDDDPDTIPRDSRVFKRVLESISNQLIDEGFTVKDETAMTVGTHVQGRVRRADAEVIQIGRDVGVDTLVIFSIYPNAKVNQNSVRVTARVTGRILGTYTGDRMGSFEAEPQAYQLVPSPYSRNDILEAVGKLAKTIGQEVGAVLAERLAGYADQPGGQLLEWVLVFDGFTDSDMREIEDILVIFSGYDSHRPKPNAVNTSTHHEYIYSSSIDSAKLRSNMNKMLDKLNMKGRISMAGNEVQVVKTTGVKQRKQQSQSEW